MLDWLIGVSAITEGLHRKMPFQQRDIWIFRGLVYQLHDSLRANYWVRQKTTSRGTYTMYLP